MNEVITFGKGYQMNNGIKVFVQSSQRCDNVTVIDLENSKDVVVYLKRNKINTPDGVVISNKYSVDLSLSPYTLKVILFYLYCKYYSKADNVYLTDFTDVYFQGNIFDNIVRDKVTVFSEENTIGNCLTNTAWINICYNADIMGLLKYKPIINGGCILGDRLLVVDLLKEMCNECTNVISRIGNYQNIDQAILNKVVHFDHARYFIEDKAVANMAQKKKGKEMKREKGIRCPYPVYCISGESMPDIIHQYDCNKQIEKELYEYYIW